MGSVTVLDGGFSTQLAVETNEVIDGRPLWTAGYLKTDPGAVFRTHMKFLDAGAEVIITNSYQASVPGFVRHLGLDEKASYDLIKISVRLARQAVSGFVSKNPSAKKPIIAGSVGPYGASLNDGSEYTGNYVDTVDMDKIINWHRTRIQALLEEGVDLLAIETIPALSEAVGLLNLLKEYPQQKFWLSFQCKDDTYLAHGERFSDAVKTCWEMSNDQLVAVGCNCVNPKFVSTLLKSVPLSVPFVVYPNDGGEYTPHTGWSHHGQDSDFTQFIGDWLDLGVKYIGGCCRTNATHVSKIKEAVSQYLGKKS